MKNNDTAVIPRYYPGYTNNQLPVTSNHFNVAVTGASAWIAFLVAENGIVELRRIHPVERHLNRSALFSDAGELLAAAEGWRHPECALYATLNRPRHGVKGSLRDRGFIQIRPGGVRWWEGIGLNAETEQVLRESQA